VSWVSRNNLDYEVSPIFPAPQRYRYMFICLNFTAKVELQADSV
jgi:hypothetical protein